MTTTGQPWSTSPSGYDMEGNPDYATDEVDGQFYAVLGRIGHEQVALDWECALNSVRFLPNASTRRDLLAVASLMIEREEAREAAGWLSQEEGRLIAQGVAMRSIKAALSGYREVAERVGWPMDPDALTDDQLDGAAMWLHLWNHDPAGCERWLVAMREAT